MRWSVVVAVACVLSSDVAAQDRTQERAARDTSVLERVVVTASRRSERLKDVVVETELLTRPALERTGAADLASALQQAGGLQIDGGTPAGVGVSLRGFDSRRVLVLIDGQPLVGRLAGHLDLSRIPLASVERIEVVRGPQSTLYGADALGGVVNIITRRPRLAARDASLSVNGGSHGRLDAAASVGVGNERAALRVEAGRRLTSLAPGIGSTQDTYARRWDAALSGSWKPSTRTSLDLATFAVDETQRYRTGQLYQFADNTQLGARIGAEQRGGISRFTQILSLSAYDHLARAATASEPVSDSGARDRQSLAQLQLGYTTVLGFGVVDAGVDLRSERIRADRVLGLTRSAESVEPFIQTTSSVFGLTVSPGVRASWHETWGTFLAPRLAVMARPSEMVTVRAALGTGYRPPDFKELYLSFVNTAAGYAVEGNPELEPERSHSASVGVHAESGHWHARITLFGNRFRNFITTGEQDAAGVFRYENIERGTTRGVESELALLWSGANLELGYDYTATRDAAARAPLPGISPHSARAILTLTPIAGTSLTLATHYSAATPLQRTQSGAAVRERGAYARTDLSIARKLGPSLTTRAGVTNAFDRSMGNEWPGFTGREVYVGLSWDARRSGSSPAP